MILKSIKLKNFRPYRGPEEIKFATGEKNITIIQGENDSGKTSLMNAITWCLYNREYYRFKGKEDIWNKSALKDLDSGDEISVEVSIVMEDNENKTVRFVRSKKFIKKDDFNCSPKNTNFNIFINDGINDSEVTFPDSYLQTHLPETLREYFLFDGEQLTTFFNTDTKGVKNAVYELSQLNLLEKVTTHTKARKSEFISQKKKLSPKLGFYLEEKEDLLKKKEEDKKNIDKNEKDIIYWENEIENLRSDLTGYGDEPSKIIKEKKDLKSELEKSEIALSRKKIDYKRFLIDNFSIIMGYPVLKELKIIGAELEEKGYIPARFKKEFLLYLLEEHECICGADLSEGSEGYEKLKELYENTDEVTNISEKVNQLIGSANTISSQYPEDFEEELKMYREDLKLLDSDIITYKRRIKNLEDKLGENAEKRVGELKNQILKFEKLSKNADKTNTILENNLKDFDDDLKDIEDKIQIEKQKENKKTQLDKDIEFCNEVIRTTKDLYDELASSIHDKLERLTSEEFKSIHWKETYDNVIIDDDFNVSFRKTDGSIIAATDPSSGSQLTLALSFMTALNSLSGFELPIVIDTPLGRLSTKIRDNLGEFLPEYTKNKQVTLIVTDTEYAGEFKNKIKEHVGKEYKLEYSNQNGEQTRVIKC